MTELLGVLQAGSRVLRRGSDDLAVLVGAALFVVGVAMLSVAAACITGGFVLALFGVGRIAFQTRGGSA